MPEYLLHQSYSKAERLKYRTPKEELKLRMDQGEKEWTHVGAADYIAAHYLPYWNVAHVINQLARSIPWYLCPFRSDRAVSRRGGGVTIYVKSLLLPTRLVIDVNIPRAEMEGC